MNQAEGDRLSDWASTLEALNLAYALSKDADDVLADCKKMRDLLYDTDRRSLRPKFKTFRALDKVEDCPFVVALVQAWRQPSPNLEAWEHPLPAETVEQFLERALADAEEGNCDVVQEAHEEYSLALERALLQKDADAWDEVRSLDRKFERLASALDLSAGLDKVMEVVFAKQERQRAHFEALASGRVSDSCPPGNQTSQKQQELERAWKSFVFAECEASLPLPAPLYGQLDRIFKLTYEAESMTDPGELEQEESRAELARVAAHMARAASVVADNSPGVVVKAITEELKLAHALLLEGLEDDVDADLELALVAFVGKMVQVRKDNLRSELVCTAYILQVARLDESESLSRWMEAELKVAGGDQATVEAAREAKEQVDEDMDDMAATKKQDEASASTQQQALVEMGLLLMPRVTALVNGTKAQAEEAQA
jgi:hypothetical protein